VFFFVLGSFRANKEYRRFADELVIAVGTGEAKPIVFDRDATALKGPVIEDHI
jgi:hypothetical protein